MSRQKVNRLYHQLLVINVICVISSVMFIVFNQFDWIPKVWGICIALLAFLTNSQEEQILSENPSNSSIYLQLII